MAITLDLATRTATALGALVNKQSVSFASAADLARELMTDASDLRRQLNGSYHRLTQMMAAADHVLGSADAAWQWLNTPNAALEGNRTPLQEMAKDRYASRVEELLMKMADASGAMDGTCFFWTETGTEGGYWAFQDARLNVPNFSKVCRKCHLYWADDGSEPPAPVDAGHCPPGEHDWTPMRADNVEWLYAGLHVLADGDWLTIYAREAPHAIVWQGEIQLRHYGAFKEDARGFWIHDDQIGLDREAWAEYFMREYPARLVLAQQRKAVHGQPGA